MLTFEENKQQCTFTVHTALSRHFVFDQKQISITRSPLQPHSIVYPGTEFGADVSLCS